MSIVAWTVIGLLAGLSAHRLAPVRRARLRGDLLVGVCGAFVGGAMFALVERRGIELHAGSVIASVMGAAVVLFTYHLAGSSASRPSV